MKTHLLTSILCHPTYGRSITHKKTTLSLLLLGAALLLSLPARADIVKGQVVDADTGEPLPNASLEAKFMLGPNSWSSMTFTADSLGRFSQSMATTGKCTFTARMIGYNDARRESYVYGHESNDTIDLGPFRLKPTALMLSEVKVSGKMKRFTMSGDTIVFHPEAFRLEEGARLDELIRKLPGVENRDGRLYWNGKPIRMMMNGKDAFGDGGMLGALPAEAVENIKAYNKASDLARATGKDDGKEDHVLDIKIKPGFMDKWYGDVEAQVQTPDRYLGSLSMQRLSDSAPMMVYANANTLNQTKLAGIGWWNWSTSGDDGQAQLGNVEYQHNWKTPGAKDWMNNRMNVGAQISNSKRWGTNYSTRQTYYPGQAKTWQLGQDGEETKSLEPKFHFNFVDWTDTLNQVSAYGNVGYTKTEKMQNNASALFDSSPFDRGDFPLEEALAATVGTPLYERMINRSRYHSTSIQESFNTEMTAGWTHNVRDGRYGVTAQFNYINELGRMNGHRTWDYLREHIAEQEFQYGRTPDRKLSLSLEAEYEQWLSKKLRLNFSYKIGLDHRNTTNSYYTSPSETLLHDSLDTWLDAANSYRSRNHTVRHKFHLGSTWNVGPLSFMPAIDIIAQHEHLDYQRGRLDTTAVRRSWMLNPEMAVRWKMGKQQGLDLKYGYTTQLPALLSTLAYTDDTNPLYVVEGNPGLRRSHTHRSSLIYNHTWLRQQATFSAELNYDREVCPVTTVMQYDAQMGIYRSHQENVRGGDRWRLNLNGDKSWSEHVRLKDVMSTSLATRYGYLATLRQGEAAQLNRQRTWNWSNTTEVTYQNDWLETTLYAQLNMTQERYSLAPTYDHTRWDNDYGWRLLVKWKKWQVQSNLHEEVQRGFVSAAFNRRMLLWDASVAYKCLHNKGLLKLSANDIFNNARYYQANVTAYQRSESWSEYLHHYLNLSFTYHLDAKAKKG